MTLASPLDVSDVFAELCSIPGHSLNEARTAAAVTALLDGLGIDWSADGAAARVGGDQDNIHAVIPSADGSTSGGILLAAHMDTVPPTGIPKPELRDGIWRNGAEGILGADNRASMAAILTAAGAWSSSPPPVPVEILFTVGEEIGLLGAEAFRPADSGSVAAFVFDHPTPIGTYVASSPTYTRVRASFHGRKAHAGVCPEQGASAIRAAARAIAAMPHGRLSEFTTANVGTVSGGDAANVVADECAFEAEIRSSDPVEGPDALLRMTDAIQVGAGEESCAVDLVVEQQFAGYRHSEQHRATLIATRALSSLGIEPVAIASGGGSDANVFEKQGIPSLNLGDGSLDTHTPDERIADGDLRRLVEIVLALAESV